MIEIRNIQKHFGSHHVLKGINLSVRKGEVVTIIGPSGSGKTTFLRCLNLLERPDEGAISLHGEVINCKKPAKKRHSQTEETDGDGFSAISFVFA